jgi:hypothetical protein
MRRAERSGFPLARVGPDRDHSPRLLDYRPINYWTLVSPSQHDTCASRSVTWFGHVMGVTALLSFTRDLVRSRRACTRGTRGARLGTCACSTRSRGQGGRGDVSERVWGRVGTCDARRSALAIDSRASVLASNASVAHPVQNARKEPGSKGYLRKKQQTMPGVLPYARL